MGMNQGMGMGMVEQCLLGSRCLTAPFAGKPRNGLSYGAARRKFDAVTVSARLPCILFDMSQAQARPQTRRDYADPRGVE